MTYNLWDQVRHFAPAEFGGWADAMEPALILFLDQLREAHGVPYRVTHAGRAEGEGSNPASEHIPHPLTGMVRAVDVEPGGGDPVEVYRAWELAHQAGIPGLGAYPERFIHLDVGQGDRRPRPARWVRNTAGDYTTWNYQETGGWPDNLWQIVAATLGLDSGTRTALGRPILREPGLIIGGVAVAGLVLAAATRRRG